METEGGAVPTCVVWLGEGPPPTQALAALGIEVRRGTAEQAAREVAELAPDLVVLAGRAAARADALAVELREARPGSEVAIAVVGEGGSVERERRSGVVARIAPGDDEAVARAVAATIARLSAPPATSTMGRVELRACIEQLVASGRAAVVAVARPQLAVVVAGGAATPRLDEVIARVGESAAVRISERPIARVRIGTAGAAAAAARLEGVAIAIVATDGEAIAAALAAAGAEARALDGRDLEAVKALDPALVIVGEDVLGRGGPLAIALCTDARLASASLLVVGDTAEIAPERWGGIVHPLVAAEIALRARVQRGERVIDRVETLGPLRWLKIVAARGEPSAMQLRGVGGVVDLQLAGGKIRSAGFRPRSGESVRGKRAVQQIVSTTWGSVLTGPPDVELDRPQLPERAPAVAGASRDPRRVTAEFEPSGGRARAGAVVVPRPGASSAPPAAPTDLEIEVEVAPTAAAEPRASARAREEDDGRDTLEFLTGIDARLAEARSKKTAPAKSASGDPSTQAEAQPAAASADVGGSADAKEPTPEARPRDAEIVEREPRVVGARSEDTADARAPVRSDAVSERAAPSVASDAARPIEDARSAPRADETRAPRTEDARSAPPAEETRAPSAPRRSRGPAIAIGASVLVVAIAVAGWGLSGSGETSTLPTVAARPDDGRATTDTDRDERPADGVPADEDPISARDDEAGGAAAAIAAPEPAGGAPSEAPIAAPSAGDDTPSPAAAPSGGDDAPTAAAAAGDVAPGAAAPSTAAPSAVVVPGAAAPSAGDDAPTAAPSPTTPPSTDDARSRVRALLGEIEQAQAAHDTARMQSLAEQILAIDPTHARAAYYVGLAHFRRDEDDEAREWARRAQEHDPDDPLPRLLQADVHLRRGRRASARPILERCVAETSRPGPCERRLASIPAP